MFIGNGINVAEVYQT